jgi:hypothetical protein
MNSFPEPGRLVGHALLDSVIAYVPDGDPELNASSANLAIAAIHEVEGALVVTADDDDALTIDSSGLIGGAMITIAQLVQRLADARGVDREAVVSEMRTYLDS